MSHKRKTPEQELKYRLYTRVNEAKYQELRGILSRNTNYDMSSLIRDILHKQQIRIYTTDKTFDNVMEQLALIREQIRAIGVNINQVVKQFNTYPEPRRKALFAHIAFDQYLTIDGKIDELFSITQKLSVRWLSRSERESQ